MSRKTSSTPRPISSIHQPMLGSTSRVILKTCLIWPRNPGPLVAFRCFFASRFCARVSFPDGLPAGFPGEVDRDAGRDLAWEGDTVRPRPVVRWRCSGGPAASGRQGARPWSVLQFSGWAGPRPAGPQRSRWTSEEASWEALPVSSMCARCSGIARPDFSMARAHSRPAR